MITPHNPTTRLEVFMFQVFTRRGLQYIAIVIIVNLPAVSQTGSIGAVGVWNSTMTLSNPGPSPWYDVTTFQARGDWVSGCVPVAPPAPAGKCTDNTTPIRNAIAQCATSGLPGCTIFFPAPTAAAGSTTVTGSYYISGTINVPPSTATTPLNGVKLIGDCAAAGSGVLIFQGATQNLHCAALVTDQAIDMIKVGPSGATLFNTFGFEIDNLALMDISASNNTANGAIHFINVNNFNLTDIACSGFTNAGIIGPPAKHNKFGYCILLDGEPVLSGGQGETQYGVII